MTRSHSKKKVVHLKAILRLPDLDHATTTVLSTLSSRDSQRSYRFAIHDFIGWYRSEPRLGFNKAAVLGYRLEFGVPSPGLLDHQPASGCRATTGLRSR